jgi:RNA-binding protein Musashi
MRDGATGRSRGFGFLTFTDARTVNIVMVKEHYLDGKIVRPDIHTYKNFSSQAPFKSHSHKKESYSQNVKIDPKRAIPRDEQERTSKIFVGGVSQEATEQDFKEYFMQFGRVVDATLMMDKDTGRPRGFGFVTFDSEAAVDACLEIPLEIHGKAIEVKKAQPRGNMREEEEARGGARGARWKKGDENQNPNQQPQGGNQMAPGGMTPQLMAQYWQRMQQYFAMMQQQMAMGRGMPTGMGGMNPAMMQQMAQMQQMQAMQQQMQGNQNQNPQSPGAAMAGMQGMNPAMMQQMQAMQQMQQMQMQGGMGAGGAAGAGAGGAGMGTGATAGGGNNPGGRVGTPGYNAYEQQAFEQQKYEQQQMRRSTRDPSQYAQGGYGMGGGAPTSWEGMYDDVPQPVVAGNTGGGGRGGFQKGGSNRGSAPPQSDPAKAPPANAPTGPKNAGKPGANYRGGGRGGQRGYHPYAR